jgi:hypothetical protein
MAKRVISKDISDLQCWISYLYFLAANGVILIGKRMPPISEDILMYRSLHIASKIWNYYIQLLNFIYVVFVFTMWRVTEYPFDSAHESTILRLNMIMLAVRRIQGEHNPKQRFPITFQVLERNCNSLWSGVFSTFTDCMLETVCTVSFLDFWGVANLRFCKISILPLIYV